MKTLIGSLIALGVLSSVAQAQYCPPGYGYRAGSYGYHRPTHAPARVIIEKAPEAVPVPMPEAPAAPVAPAPAEPQPEPAPPK